MAFRKLRNIVEDDQPAETEVEGEIREFVRRDVVTNLGRPPENESEIVANSINSVLHSTKIIAESLTQLKKAPDAPTLPDLKDRSVAS
jgi:hypothetical protein